MESPIEKPFKCSTCLQSFTNEDHLQVHRKRHEMSLSLGFGNGSSTEVEIQAPEGFTDETPTPTRFFRISEEVGFFQDIQNVNPFDEQFSRATSSGTSTNDNQNFSLSLSTLCSNDTLNTPQVLGFTPTPTPLPLSSSSTQNQNLMSASTSLPSEAAQPSDAPQVSPEQNPEKEIEVILAQKAIPFTASTAPTSISSIIDSPAVDKRTELLERNRAAAIRSRERRKQWVSELEMKNKQLITLLGQVHSELKRIRGENVALKEELSKHSSCNVTLQAINQSNETQKTKSGMDQAEEQSNVQNSPNPRCPNPPATSVEVTILPKPIQANDPSSIVIFPKPNLTKVKRGRPRKGFEKRASLMLPPPPPLASGPPIKIKILPLHSTATKVQQSPTASNVIVLHRGSET